MRKYEKYLLAGSFFSLISAFLPWHSFIYSYQFPGLSGEYIGPNVSGMVMGYDLPSGKAVIICALILLVITLVPKNGDVFDRIMAAKVFLSAMVLFFLIFGGFAPIFSYGITPKLGLLSLFVGCILLFLGLRKGLSEERY